MNAGAVSGGRDMRPGEAVAPAAGAAAGPDSPASARSRHTVIVGLGNDIAGDDAIGILAARLLQERVGQLAEIVELPWGGLNLLTAICGFRRAILIDSLQSGRYPPGTIVRLSEHEFAGSVRLNSFHDLNYPTALKLGRRLGWSVPACLTIYAVEGHFFDRITTQLSPPVAAALPRLVERVARSIVETAPMVARPDVGDVICSR